MKGNIYIIRNKINNKVYIGQTICNIQSRFSQHKSDIKRRYTPLYNAMNKYGMHNFTIELLEECLYEELDLKEVQYISKYNSIFPNGYNMSEGGKQYRTDEELKRMSQRMSGENNPMYGAYQKLNPFYKKVHTEDTKKYIGNFNKEYWNNMSDEDKSKKIEILNKAREKVVANGGGFKGKRHTEEAIKSIKSKTTGVPKSEETKRKMSENNTGKCKVEMLDIKTSVVLMTFESMKQGAEWIKSNISKYPRAKGSEISSVCSGKKKTAYGYKWRKYA